MKIIAGKYKGRNFYMPAGIRPSQGILREAIFDLLGHDLEGVSFLDLFAGSGAVGLEAISRGAKEVVMVERDPKCAKVIRENLDLLGITAGFDHQLLNADCFATVKQMSLKNRRFDLVFFDPPYGIGGAKKTLKLLGGYDILHPHSLVLGKYDKADEDDPPEGLKLVEKRRYGSSYLTIYQRVK